MRYLTAGGYVDRRTIGVGARTVFYNPELRHLAVMRLDITFTDEGTVRVSQTVRILDAEDPDTAGDAITVILIVLALIGKAVQVDSPIRLTLLG